MARAAFLLRILLTFIAAATGMPRAGAAEATRSAQGDALVLENDLVRARILPGNGATLASLQYKPANAELIGAGAFADCYLLPGHRTQDLTTTAFDAPGGRAAQAGEDASWVLTARAPAEVSMTPAQKTANMVGNAADAVVTAPEAIFETPPYENLVITKTFRLRAGSAALHVTYELKNTGAVPLTVCLGTRHAFRSGGVKQWLSVPSRDGAVSFPVPMKRGETQNVMCLEGGTHAWLYDTIGGWHALLGDRGVGLLGWSDPRHVSFLSVDTTRGVVQLGRTKVTLAPGGTFTTTAWVMPVAGLSRLDGASGELAAAFEVTPAAADGAASLVRKTTTDDKKLLKTTEPRLAAPGEDLLAEERAFNKVAESQDTGAYKGGAIHVRIDLVSARDRGVQVAFRQRLYPRGEWAPITSRQCDLAAGKVIPLKVQFAPRRKGTYVVGADVTANGRALGHFERCVIAGEPSGLYMPEAPKREGEINRDFWYLHVQKKPGFPIRPWWTPSTKVVTPHVEFARPLAGGPIRALVVVPYYSSRDLVELQERMDLDVDCVTIGIRGYRRKWEGYKRSLLRGNASVDEIDRMRTLLNRPHEVIVLAVLYGDWFPVDIMDEIVRQVRDDGVGLVLANPEQLVGSLAQMVKAAKPGRFAMPQSRSTTAGKGRLAVIDGENSHWSIPWIGNSENERCELTRMIRWAARGEPAVSVELKTRGRVLDRARLAQQRLTFSLRNAGKTDFSGRLRLIPRGDVVADYPFYGIVRTRDRVFQSWEPAAAVEQDVSLPAGSARSIPLTLAPMAAGHYALDVAVLDGQGATVSWRRFPVSVRAAASIVSAELSGAGAEPRTFKFDGAGGTDLLFSARPSDTIKLTCRLAGGIERVRLRGEDPWGRVVFEQEQKVDAGRPEVRFEQSLHSCLHRVLIVKIQARDAAGCVSERRLQGFVQPWPERLPAYELGSYSICSLIRPDVTGYNNRFGIAVFPVGVAHAWLNVQMQEYGGRIPGATKIKTPDDKDDTPPDVKALKIGEMDEDKELTGLSEKLRTKDELGELQKKSWIRVPCLLDPAWRKPALDSLGAKFREMTFFGPFKNFLVDEWFYCKEEGKKSGEWRRSFVPGRDTNICRCKYCLKSFSAYARDLYGGGLDRLNAEWGTHYTKWEDVDPPLLSADPKKPPREQMWPHILDHRHFIDREVADFYHDAYDTVKAVSPLCKTGVSGMWKTSIWNGTDIYLMAAWAENNNLYRDFAKWASFGRPGTGGGAQWVGYSKKYSPIREDWVAWHGMLEGLAGLVYYGKETWPMHHWDLTFMEGPKAFFHAFHEIRDRGIDRLLVGHQYVDPVALHYDPTSLYLAQLEEWAEDAPKFIEGMRNAGRSYYEICHQVAGTYKGLLKARRLDYFWTAYGQLDKGSFGRFGTPRILFLPYTQCLSEREAATLAEFVKQGGILVGDVHTGFRDRHGKRLAKGRLDEVFGIRRRGPAASRVRKGKDGKPVVVTFGKDFGEPFAMTFGAVGPGDVEATTARPLASYTLDGARQPAFLVNEYGKGRGVYLNFIPSGYEAVQRVTEEGEHVVKELEGKAGEYFRRVFDKLLGMADLRCPIECTPGSNVYRFGEGDITYIGVEAGYKHPENWDKEYEVRLPQAHYLYDIRAGRFIGHTDHFTVRYDRKRLMTVLLFAAMPYKVEGIGVDLAAASVAPGGSLTFEARVLPAEAQRRRHVLSLRVRDPRGRDLPWYGTCIETKDGVARGRVDLAASDAPGTWTLRLTDAATGTVQEKEFEVRARDGK